MQLSHPKLTNRPMKRTRKPNAPQSEAPVIRRVALFLTEEQRRELRRRAAVEGHGGVSEYVTKALALDREAA